MEKVNTKFLVQEKLCSYRRLPNVRDFFPLAIYWHALSTKLLASPSGSKKMTAMLCGSFLWMTLLAVFMPVFFAKSAKTARQLFHFSISDSHAHRAKKM